MGRSLRVAPFPLKGGACGLAEPVPSLLMVCLLQISNFATNLHSGIINDEFT